MEINKFRIFDKEENEYCQEPDYRWMLSRQGKLYNSENDEWHILGERYIIEFFTGLTDKTGVEIYEGDIVKYYQPYAKRWDTRKVIFDKEFACFGAARFESFTFDECDWVKIEEIEVIGNIHEK